MLAPKPTRYTYIYIRSPSNPKTYGSAQIGAELGEPGTRESRLIRHFTLCKTHRRSQDSSDKSRVPITNSLTSTQEFYLHRSGPVYTFPHSSHLTLQSVQVSPVGVLSPFGYPIPESQALPVVKFLSLPVLHHPTGRVFTFPPSPPPLPTRLNSDGPCG